MPSLSKLRRGFSFFFVGVSVGVSEIQSLLFDCATANTVSLSFRQFIFISFFPFFSPTLKSPLFSWHSGEVAPLLSLYVPLFIPVLLGSELGARWGIRGGTMGPAMPPTDNPAYVFNHQGLLAPSHRYGFTFFMRTLPK